MNTNITQTDLLLYAYNELEEPRRSVVELALSLDEDLKSKYLEISEMQSVLDTAIEAPHNTSLQIILEESSSSLELI